MSDHQHTEPNTRDTPSPRRLGRNWQIAISAVATAVIAGLIYTLLGYTLGPTGFLIAVVLWFAAIIAGLARRTPRGIGVAIGCAVLAVAVLIAVLLRA